MTTTKSKQGSPTVGDICLYGTQQLGYGYLVMLAGEGRPWGESPDSGPMPYSTMTSAIWTAVDKIRERGIKQGKVTIYEPTGSMSAVADIGQHVPTAGSLKWERAMVWVISAEEIERAGTK